MNSVLAAMDGKLLLSLISALYGLCITAFVWQRSKSSHSWLSKLWFRYRGKLEYDFPIITNYFHELDAVDHFRFITGIRAETINSVDRIIRWARRRNVAPAKIADCGQFFDLSKGRLKTRREMPHLFFAVTAYLLGIALLGLAICFLVGTISDKALLSFTKSGTYFTLDEREAKPLGKPALPLVNCKQPVSAGRGYSAFTKEEVFLICDEFIAGRVAGFVKATVSGQRIASGAALAPACVLLSLIFIFTTTWAKATALRRSILRSRLQSRQHKKGKRFRRAPQRLGY